MKKGNITKGEQKGGRAEEGREAKAPIKFKAFSIDAWYKKEEKREGRTSEKRQEEG